MAVEVLVVVSWALVDKVWSGVGFGYISAGFSGYGYLVCNCIGGSLFSGGVKTGVSTIYGIFQYNGLLFLLLLLLL